MSTASLEQTSTESRPSSHATIDFSRAASSRLPSPVQIREEPSSQTLQPPGIPPLSPFPSKPNPTWTKRTANSMNPCASAFTPKPTYADTVKASLPQCSTSNGQAAVGQRSGVGRALRDGEQQVGVSINHHHKPPSQPAGQSIQAIKSSIGTSPTAPSNEPPNPTIQVTCEHDAVANPLLFEDPRLLPLYCGHTHRREYLNSSLHDRRLTGGFEMGPSDQQRVNDGQYTPSLYDWFPPMPQNLQYDGCGINYPRLLATGQIMPTIAPWQPSRSDNMAHSMQQHVDPTSMYSPGLDAYAVLYPYSPPHFSPAPFSSMMLHPHDMPGGPGIPAPHHWSRPNSGQKRRRSGCRRAEGTRSHESSNSESRRPHSQHSRNRTTSSRARPDSQRDPMLQTSTDLSALGQLAPTASVPERGRPRYQIVSTAPNDLQIGWGDHSEGVTSPGREASANFHETALTATSSAGSLDDRSGRPKAADASDNERPVTPDPIPSPSGHGPSIESGNAENGPPPNAPTGPASLRRQSLATDSVRLQNTSSLTRKPPDVGTWSQSKRWISQETKERAAFQKLMQTLRYMGADRSPFLPQTPAELTAFRIEEAEKKTSKLTQMLNKRMEDRDRLKACDSHAQGQHTQPKLELFGGKKLIDSFSPVFAQITCFNVDVSTDEKAKVEWPSLAELKEEGDRRAARYGRYLPLPRLNIVASCILHRESDGAYNSDGSISWNKKAVKLTSRFLRPVSSETDPPFSSSSHFQTSELPATLQCLLDEIDGEELSNKGSRDEGWRHF